MNVVHFLGGPGIDRYNISDISPPIDLTCPVHLAPRIPPVDSVPRFDLVAAIAELAVLGTRSGLPP